MTKVPLFTFMNSKGGVGKSSVATTTAKMLAMAKKVGLLDADFCSSNTEQIMKIKHQYAEFAELRSGYRVKPRKLTDNLSFMAITCVQSSTTTGVQQDGVVQKSSLKMMIEDVVWGKIDCMIIDMPAGTDDLFTYLGTELKKHLKGIFIVTQPKTIVDCRRVIQLCGIKGLPILGLVENMSGSLMECHHTRPVCPMCGDVFDPFGPSSAEKLCKLKGIDYLGALPLIQGSFEHLSQPVISEVVHKIMERI